MYLPQSEFNERMRSAKLRLDSEASALSQEEAREELVAQGIPAVLVDSWMRCQSLGLGITDTISARGGVSPRPSGRRLQHLLHSDEVMRTARSATDDIIKAMGSWPCVVWVVDLHGQVLSRSVSFPHDFTKGGGVGAVIGPLAELPCIDELSCGTTARAVDHDRSTVRVLVGEQHYLSCLSDAVTLARGIYLNGERVADAVMCSWWGREDDAFLWIEPGADGFFICRAMEGLVSSLANIVSLELENLYQSQRTHIMREVLENSIAYASEPLLITDDCGSVRTINSSARRFLGMRRAAPDERMVLRMASNDGTLSVLRSGRIVINVRLEVELPNGQKRSYYGDIRPIFGGNKNVLHGNTIRLRRPASDAKDESVEMVHFEDLIGTDQRFTNAKLRAMVGASSFEPLLLVGEPGTGKKSFARAIHSRSHDDTSAFVMIDCAMFTKEYAEKMLYGVLEAGESEGMQGVFERANQGTLVLSEVSELDMELQKAMAAIMDMGTVRRIGEYDQRQVRVKLVATTSKGDLTELLEAGKLDEGLYLRLLTSQITLPSLRERGQDILPLAYHFINEFCIESDAGRISMEDEVVQALRRYDWPGNLKQLRYFMRHACYLCKNRTIDLSCMPEVLQHLLTEGEVVPREEEDAQSMRAARGRLIKSAIQNANGNMTQAAKILGVSRSTLYRWCNEEGL